VIELSLLDQARDERPVHVTIEQRADAPRGDGLAHRNPLDLKQFQKSTEGL